MSGLVLGVDGGGTKTEVAIADASGRVLGTGRSGTTNHDDADAATVAENLQAAIAQARIKADVGAASFDAAFLGLGGVVSERDRARVRSILRRTELADARRLEIDHDIRIALAGGLAGRQGIVVIVGTGSACYGRRSDGASWRAGGWGPLLADEGSGYWLGREALVAAVRAHDGRMPETRLAHRMLVLLGIASADDVMHRVYVQGLERAEIAAFAPAVLQLAREGDSLAREILRRGANELVRCIEAVAARLELRASGCEVTYAGSIVEHSAEMRAGLAEGLRHALPGASVMEPALSPVRGACLLALEGLGVEVAHALENLSA